MGPRGRKDSDRTERLHFHFRHIFTMCSVIQLWLTLCNPMDCCPQSSSTHGLLQARILEWVAISYSRGSSRPRDQTHVSCISALAGRFFTTPPPGKPFFFFFKNTINVAFFFFLVFMQVNKFSVYCVGNSGRHESVRSRLSYKEKGSRMT